MIIHPVVPATCTFVVPYETKLIFGRPDGEEHPNSPLTIMSIFSALANTTTDARSQTGHICECGGNIDEISYSMVDGREFFRSVCEDDEYFIQGIKPEVGATLTFRCSSSAGTPTREQYRSGYASCLAHQMCYPYNGISRDRCPPFFIAEPPRVVFPAKDPKERVKKAAFKKKVNFVKKIVSWADQKGKREFKEKNLRVRYQSGPPKAPKRGAKEKKALKKRAKSLLAARALKGAI